MVRVENPGLNQRPVVDGPRAAMLVSRGEAVVTIRACGTVRQIRMLEPLTKAGLQLATRGGYDGVRRTFFEEAAALPLVQAQKMVREEKSDRNWSYTAAVKRTLRCSDHKDAGRPVAVRV